MSGCDRVGSTRLLLSVVGRTLGWIGEQLQLNVVRIAEHQDGGAWDGVGRRDRRVDDRGGFQSRLPGIEFRSTGGRRTPGGQGRCVSRRTRPARRPRARSALIGHAIRCGGGRPCDVPRQATRTPRPAEAEDFDVPGRARLDVPDGQAQMVDTRDHTSSPASVTRPSLTDHRVTYARSRRQAALGPSGAARLMGDVEDITSSANCPRPSTADDRRRYRRDRHRPGQRQRFPEDTWGRLLAPARPTRTPSPAPWRSHSPDSPHFILTSPAPARRNPVADLDPTTLSGGAKVTVCRAECGRSGRA